MLLRMQPERFAPSAMLYTVLVHTRLTKAECMYVIYVFFFFLVGSV